MNLEYIAIEQMLSSVQWICIFNSECAVLPPPRSDAETAELATEITLRPLNRYFAWVAPLVNDLPVPHGASRKYRQISSNRGWIVDELTLQDLQPSLRADFVQEGIENLSLSPVECFRRFQSYLLEGFSIFRFFRRRMKEHAKYFRWLWKSIYIKISFWVQS